MEIESHGVLTPSFEASTGPANGIYHLLWYGRNVGSFSMSADEMTWLGYTDPKYAKLFSQREEDGMPHFLVNMKPDNTMYTLLNENNQFDYIANGLRFLSNLTIIKDGPTRTIEEDRQIASLDAFTVDGTFSGKYEGPFPKDEGEGLAADLMDYWRDRHVPRFSGAEVKLPATLDETGFLHPAISTPFTHIIKFPNEYAREAWGFNEWMCLELSQSLGLDTAKHALLPLRDGKEPAIVVERFDIPHDDADNKQYIIQDFCTLAGLPPTERGAGSLEQVAKAMRALSTNPEEDMRNLYKRAILSIAVNDGDMHRKNIALLFEYDPKEDRYINVRMSPSYDITSEIWVLDADQRQTLAIDGRREKAKVCNLVNFAKRLGLSADEAESILRESLTNIAENAVRIANTMPEEAAKFPSCVYTARRIATIAVKTARKMGAATPEWETLDPPPAKMGHHYRGEKLVPSYHEAYAQVSP